MATIKRNFSYDKDTNTALYTLKYKNNSYIGIAHCHNNDLDMETEYTGIAIAQMRAEKKFLQSKLNEAIIRLSAIKHLKSTIENSNKYNSNSYEYKRVCKEYNNLINEVNDFKRFIKDKENDISTYITEKESFYKLIRKNRKDKTR